MLLKSRRLYARPMDKSTGVVCDQSILLTVANSAWDYPDKLRQGRYHNTETEKTLVFLTNNFLLPAITIVQLYKQGSASLPGGEQGLEYSFNSFDGWIINGQRKQLP